MLTCVCNIVSWWGPPSRDQPALVGGRRYFGASRIRGLGTGVSLQQLTSLPVLDAVNNPMGYSANESLFGPGVGCLFPGRGFPKGPGPAPWRATPGVLPQRPSCQPRLPLISSHSSHNPIDLPSHNHTSLLLDIPIDPTSVEVACLVRSF